MLIGLSLLLLTACQPGLTPAARPTPIILTVQSTPALQSLAETYQACAREAGNTGLVLLDKPAASLDPSQADLALRWGPASSVKSYAAIIGEEELVIVANPQNPLISISLAELQAIYNGKLHDWPDSSPPVEIQPWGYLPGDDAQTIFEAGVLKGETASGHVTSIAPDPSAMREAVAGNTAVIGFLPRRWLNQTVKELPVDDLDPANLRQPILAFSTTEPGGVGKSWLVCVQKRLSN